MEVSDVLDALAIFTFFEIILQDSVSHFLVQPFSDRCSWDNRGIDNKGVFRLAKLIDRIHVDVEIRLRDKKVINSFDVSFFDDVFNLLMNFG